MTPKWWHKFLKPLRGTTRTIKYVEAFDTICRDLELSKMSPKEVDNEKGIVIPKNQNSMNQNPNA